MPFPLREHNIKEAVSIHMQGSLSLQETGPNPTELKSASTNTCGLWIAGQRTNVKQRERST